jgi:hypothetical protein
MGEMLTWADVALVAGFVGMSVMFVHVAVHQGRALSDPNYRKAWLLATARLRRDRRAKQRAKRHGGSKTAGEMVRPSTFFPSDRTPPSKPPL